MHLLAGQLFLEFDAAHAGHADVKHQATTHAGLEGGQEIARRSEGFCIETDLLYEPTDLIAYRGIVIDDKNGRLTGLGAFHVGTLQNRAERNRTWPPVRHLPPARDARRVHR